MELLVIDRDGGGKQSFGLVERQYRVLSRVQLPSAHFRYWEGSARQPLENHGGEGAEEALDYGFVGWRLHRRPANAGAHI